MRNEEEIRELVKKALKTKKCNKTKQNLEC